jgi:hypothetical protein
MAAPTNPFLPADMGTNVPPPLELARDPRPGGAVESARVSGEDVETSGLPEPQQNQGKQDSPGRALPLTRTVPVVYTNPDGGMGRFILWALAACGFAALVFVGSRALSPKPAAPPQTAAAAPVAPAAPVNWKSVARGGDVLVRIEVAPRAARAGARLMLDGAPLASNPVLLPKGSTHTVSASADGYLPASVAVTADAEKAVALELERAVKR